MKKISLCLIVLIGFASLTAVAQIGGVVNQVGNTQNREQLNQAAQAAATESNSVPQLYEGESSDVGPQSVVQAKARRTLFEASADVQLFYTDNVLLTRRDKIDTGLLVSTVEFALAPTPYAVGGGTLSPQLGYRHQWFDFLFNHNKIDFSSVHLSDLDFNAETVFAGALWTRDNWTFGGGLDAARLLQTDNYHQFYAELVPHWIARRTFALCEKTALAVSYEGDYRFTHIAPQFLEFSTSDASDRTDHSLVFSLTHVLCQHAVFQPYYRMQYTHFISYPEGSRNDFLNSVGAGLYWLVCPNFTVRTFVNYDLLESDNRNVDNYRKLDAGGGIDLSIRF